MSTGQFHKLLSPLSLGSGLTLKNRMIKAPQSSWFFEDDGSAGDRVIDFYEAIAAGGVGLVIVSAITWRSRPSPPGLTARSTTTGSSPV